MVVIRLARGGAKKRPFFNIVVADARVRRDGRFIERVGFYNPVASGAEQPLRVAGADEIARVGVAMGDLFPRVSLTGNVGVRALSFGALGDAGNDRYAFGPSISWGLFDYGHLRQQIAAADARSAAQLANYQQTVLLALEDTDNALSDYGRERQRLVHLQAAVTAGDQAAELAMKRFTGGVADFLTVLDAYRVGPDSDDLSEWIAYNRHFHIAIADLCGNARLSSVARDVIEQFDRLTYTSVSLTGPKGRAQFVGEHVAMIEAIMHRDRRHALSLAKDHVEGAKRIVLETLEHPTIVP